MNQLKRRFLKRTALGLCLTAASLLGLSNGASASVQERSYILATATTGGTYYPVGVALSTLVKVKLEPTQKISLSAISSAGSAENIKLLAENQVQFGILMGLYGDWAWKGTGRIAKPHKNLRSVTMLWQNVEHFVVKSEYAKTGTIEDLAAFQGEKFSIGKRNSGAEGSARHILAGLAIDPDSFELAYLGYGASADALQNGAIEGMNIPAGAPTSAVTRAFANLGEDIRVLEFTDAQLAKINRDSELYSPYVIKAGTYPNQTQDIRTIAQPNILAVRADVDEDAVYQITKAIYENLPFLQNIHKATKAMALEKAIVGLPMPLHPGAVRYFREQGIEIPARLLAH